MAPVWIQTASGEWVHGGDHVRLRDGATGVVSTVYHDGDVEVALDGGQTEIVKWRHVAGRYDPDPMIVGEVPDLFLWGYLWPGWRQAYAAVATQMTQFDPLELAP